VSSDGEKASAAWRRTLDGTERRVHDQEERGGDADLVDRAHERLLRTAVDTRLLFANLHVVSASRKLHSLSQVH
tara:strand:- start:319 stop:540 length:222 start_codon:yes stop_codon:yes gene_type:complete